MHENTKLLLLLLGMHLLMLFLVIAYPLGYSLYISFFRWNMLRPAITAFNGFKNYIEIFHDPYFWRSLKITLHFVGLTVIFQMILGLVLALLLYRPFKGSHLIRTLVLFPYVIPGIITGIIWKWIFNTDYGLLRLVSNSSILSNPSAAIYGVIIVDIWHMTPFVFILVMAGLQSLPESIYDAASIDGADGFQKLIYITLPLIKRLLLIIFIIRFLAACKTFDKIYALTEGGPGFSTQVISWSIYIEGFKAFEIGYAAAISYLLLILVACLGVFYGYMIKDEEGGY